MAIIKGSVIGNFKGRLGNLSARIRGGTTILSARPSSFNVNNDPALVEVRKKFAVSALFAQKVRAVPLLEIIWNKVKDPLTSAFNKMMQDNFIHVTAARPTEKNIITPGGFPLPVQAASVLADQVSLQLFPLVQSAQFGPDEKNLGAAILICFYNPIDPLDKAFESIVLADEIQDYDFTQPFELNITFEPYQVSVAAKYQDNILFAAVASKAIDGKVIKSSASYSKLS